MGCQNKYILKHIVFISFLTCFSFTLLAQQLQPTPSNQIFLNLQKLNVLGNAMYLAAHPDDENTRLISYLTHEKNFRTTYLSLTRGDGGQNLIGTELGASLGVLRTLELLRARSVDGGNQWFTRANDFGFSKHPDETLTFWNEDEILKDIVHAIRKFKPDFIINRFSTKNPGETHGHHSASALLADKAIILAADPAYKIPGSPYPAWQVNNMFFNTSYFFYKSQEEFDKADKSELYKVDCGLYYQLLGLSNGEIAAKSRSMHRCQGFGSAYSRGSSMEYLELLTGHGPKDKTKPFDDVNTGWTRIEGGQAIGQQLENVIQHYDFNNPAKSLPQLIEIAKLIPKVQDPFWREIKTADINSIILDCMGFYTEAVTNQKTVCPGDSIAVNMEYVVRAEVPFKLEQISLLGNNLTSSVNEIPYNKSMKETFKIKIAASTQLTSPYWLQGKSSPMMYDVRNRELIGRPENVYPLTGTLKLKIYDYDLTLPINILYKDVDPAYGQRYGEVQVIPPVAINMKDNAIIANRNGETQIHCTVYGFKPDVSGQLKLDLPKGWKSIPESYLVNLKLKNESKDFTFQIKGPVYEGIDSVGAQLFSDGILYNRGFQEIKYEHVPYRIINISNKIPMSVLPPVHSKELIGYIEGAGDLVFQSLRSAGYHIELISPEQFDLEHFKQYKSILVGIRAFNVLDNAAILNKNLNEYAASGGRVIVQYNTNRGLNVKNIGPYDLSLGRSRVTDEHAEVKILQPNHPIFNKPNKITEKDFNYWVQERGLYFADKYSEQYQPLLEMKDKGEPNHLGSLIYADYGKGSYIYTGLVFYRELPAGIPGAYRLIENLLYSRPK